MLVPGMYLVNRYEILEKIGSGGMADVYKAKCHVLNRLVAIKVLKQEYSTDATFVKKFRVEAQSAAGLSHPNIVNVYDVGEDNGIYFIVMELVQGITLKNYIDMKGKLDIREALNISVQIASGLSAAHDNRIIHRDIKPQNIIMSRDGKVKVTDFGIAKVADSTTVTTTAAGTVHYISPEQARGGYSDEKSDIYSLGITMYEMVTGRVPFEGETNVAVALLHIQGEMVPPRELEPSIPKSFEKIILKCTQKKPDRRYASARELIADLRKVLTHPDGEYVVIPGTVPAGRTIVMQEDDISSLKEASLHKGDTKIALDDDDIRTEKKPSARKQSVKKVPVRDDEFDPDDDDDDEEVNPALGKVMMALGIGGFVILAVIIFFIIGHAAGLFGGGLFGGKNVDSDSVTESVTETASEDENQIGVPDLFDKTESEAMSELNKIGLGITVKQGASEDVEKGKVFRQDPEAGEKVAKHTTITVYISTGKETFELEDVSGMDYNQASDLLESVGLKVELEFSDDDTVEKDKVISTSPTAGSKVAEGDTVTLKVSEGTRTEYVKMPNVMGYDIDDAIEAIENAGLNYNSKSSDYSDTYGVDQVMDQSISAGSSVVKGSNVTLTVSLGPRIRSYTATLNFPSPFGVDIPDENGEPQVYTEGQVTVTVEQDGTTKTIYDAYVKEDELPSSYAVTSESSSPGTATLYINGREFESWSVSFE